MEWERKTVQLKNQNNKGISEKKQEEKKKEI